MEDMLKNNGAGHFGATVSAPPFRRSPFRRWDFSELGHLGTGRFGAGHVIDADGTRAV